MLQNLVKKIFGSRNSRLLKQYGKVVDKINAKEPQMQAMSDEELQAFSASLKEKVQNGAGLNEVLVDAFALCREASKRVLGMRHFDVQLIGGLALHEGKIAEMRTGEGKTLVATLPVYLNALAGRGTHVVTVNDYLASRDAATMGKLYNFLGMSVGVNLPQMAPEQKQAAYACDITYGTNNEYGFDYLRDNMVPDARYRVQRPLYFAVVDEVDSILIDEARTPLIISGVADDDIELYRAINKVPAQLIRQSEETGAGDFWVDEKSHQIILSEAGHEHAEEILTQMKLLPEGESLYSAHNMILMHHLLSALRAHNLYHKDQHYVVTPEGEIVIVDEFTGRLMSGRRWSDGLHQAVEAKEGVNIKQENQTLASITFQNYFRLYEKLAGMTGTADTEAYEFQNIYNLETVIIPTHMPMIRQDFNDQIYRTAAEKYEAVIADIKARHEKDQPILVGTTSIETSELVSHMLDKEKLPHNVLNAKEHAREAEIIAQAGQPGMITVATNMAGRGTDIVLGGNIEPTIAMIQNDESLSDDQKSQKINALREDWQRLHDQVIAAGGLHIIGTERHESRRIDNQLRGRSGRQGDPGSSRFYLSFEDSLLRIFAFDRAGAILDRLAPERGIAIEHGLLTRQIEGGQRKVEGRNFDIRKQLLDFDNVSNDQRKVIYKMRNDILDNEITSEDIAQIRQDVLSNLIDQYISDDKMEEEWDVSALQHTLTGEFHIDGVNVPSWLSAEQQLDATDIKERILNKVEADYAEKFDAINAETVAQLEKSVMLRVIDQKWLEHLAQMDYLRQGIHLRGYAQKDPKQEFKRESFAMFQDLLSDIYHTLTQILISVRIDVEPIQAEEQQQADASDAPNKDDFSPEALAEKGISVGRNELCPCGSGKKYKNCHGKLS